MKMHIDYLTANIELLKGLLKISTNDEVRIEYHKQLELLTDELTALKGQSGFSLLEAMMTLAVSLVGALAMLNMAASTLSAERNVASLNDYNNLQDRIKLHLSNPQLCPITIKKAELESIDLSGESISVGTKLTSGSTVTHLSLTLLALTGNPNEYSAYLNIAGIKNPVASGPKLLKAQAIPVTVVIDASRNIVACSSNTNAPLSVSPSPTPLPSPTPEPNAGINADYVRSCAEMHGTWKQEGNSKNFYCDLTNCEGKL